MDSCDAQGVDSSARAVACMYRISLDTLSRVLFTFLLAHAQMPISFFYSRANSLVVK